MMMRYLLLVLCLVNLFSCQDKNIKEHPYSFYYWRTALGLSQLEKSTLDDSTHQDFYVRFFDVDKINGKFEPIAVAIKNETFNTDKNIVPVIYITNRTFLNIQPQEIDFLANSIYKLIEQKLSTFEFHTPPEIQIDCDWTKGTKDDYFKFLKALKIKSNKRISCTLRLHQVKFKDTSGVPPVDKVYLMCYSTSSPLENSTKNSILDVSILKNYLAQIEQYPIKNISVALPIYSWGIIENHVGKHKLINAISKHDLNHPNFKKLSDDEALIMKDGFYFGFYLNKGFKIKVEEVTDKTLNQVIVFLEDKIQSFPIVYYQLDERFILNRTFKH